MQIVEQDFEILTPINGDKILQEIEYAGRTCYKSEHNRTVGSAKEFVAKILRLGHESVIEHVVISVKITCDRGISHEIVRHRLASYSQESTRYCNYGSSSIKFICPLPLQGAAYEIWEGQMIRAENAYKSLLQIGIQPQFARSVLPNSLKTELVMTCNLREWRHFLKVRTSKAAHPQMRELAISMLLEFRKRIPVVFDEVGLTE